MPEENGSKNGKSTILGVIDAGAIKVRTQDITAKPVRKVKFAIWQV